MVVSQPPSSEVLGMTGAGGLTVIAGLPAGRVGLLFSVEGYKPLRCRLEVRSGVADTVRAFLLPEDQVAVWTSTEFGCRKARP